MKSPPKRKREAASQTLAGEQAKVESRVSFSDTRLAREKKRISEFLSTPLRRVAFTLLQMEGHPSVAPLDDARAHGARVINAGDEAPEEKAHALRCLDEELRTLNDQDDELLLTLHDLDGAPKDLDPKSRAAMEEERLSKVGKRKTPQGPGRQFQMPESLVRRIVTLLEASASPPTVPESIAAATSVLAYEEENWKRFGDNRNALIKGLSKAARDLMRKPARDAARRAKKLASTTEVEAGADLGKHWPMKTAKPGAARSKRKIAAKRKASA